MLLGERDTRSAGRSRATGAGDTKGRPARDQPPAWLSPRTCSESRRVTELREPPQPRVLSCSSQTPSHSISPVLPSSETLQHVPYLAADFPYFLLQELFSSRPVSLHTIPIGSLQGEVFLTLEKDPLEVVQGSRYLVSLRLPKEAECSVF